LGGAAGELFATKFSPDRQKKKKFFKKKNAANWQRF